MYFAAMLARTEDGWEASDTELDNVETLSDIADLARESAINEDTVLVLIEQEDAWFGVVRVDGEDDPRVYLSNAAVANRSSYGAMLVEELVGREDDEDVELDALDLDGTEDGEPDIEEEDESDDGAAASVAPNGPLGDTRLLEDLGVDEKVLLALDGDALTSIADVLGCTEILEAVR
ncbi:tRNA adenosine deaminase-associated protein [Streptomyces sp. L500]|uniref:tRNA adenosine deaminase-associated protein n=1 Tax=Streptomyces abikoensis TaxID=97398 RepID=UPI0033C6CF47